jgi:hypothetical protein
MIRAMRPEDDAVLRRIHAEQGIDYAFPDLDSPLFFVKKVSETSGRVDGALVLRLCAETSLLLNRQRGPQEKMAVMRELQQAVLAEAYDRGLDEIHAAIPEIGFDKRLRQLGWVKDRPGWHLWSRATS